MKNNRTHRSSYDVAVIGGGPGGAAAATFLQRQGHGCLILENSEFPRYHVGESLIPHTYGILDRLGLLPEMKRSHFPEKHSVRFVSPSGRESDPFYFSETIEGDGARTWQVERSEFDRLCLDNAREFGAEIRTATVKKVVFENGRAVGVRALFPGGEEVEIASRVVIDASGRATVIGSQLGLREPVPDLQKASVWSYYSGGQRLEGIDAGETTIFTLDGGGWFWYIPLPDDIVGVGVVDSPEALFEPHDDYEGAFLRAVEGCAPLRSRLAAAERTEPVRGLKRLAYRNREFSGDGWVLVGDAAAFLDPIYSSGLLLALASAELAAGCVHDALEDGDLSAARLGAFASPLGEGVDVIYRLIQAFYDPAFSFGRFVERFPTHRSTLIDCLVGDVVGKNMDSFKEALAEMSPPPAPLGVSSEPNGVPQFGAN